MTRVVDLSLVAPDRRDEIARRIAAVRKYLAFPSRRAAIDGAAELGLGLVTFYKLAKAWRLTPRAEELAGAGRPRERRSTMSADQIRIVENAIATSPHLDRDSIVDHAFALADAANVALPTRHIVRLHVDRKKPAAVPAAAMVPDADLVLDECVVDIPVAFHGQVIRPLCSVLFDARTLTPLGLHLTERLPDVGLAAASILDALHREALHLRGPAGGPLLDLHVGSGPEWTALTAALADAGIATATRPLRARGSGEVMMNAIGATKGLRFKPRLLFSCDRSFDYRLRAEPMVIGDAADILRARLGMEKPREAAGEDARRQSGALAEALSSIVGLTAS